MWDCGYTIHHRCLISALYPALIALLELEVVLELELNQEHVAYKFSESSWWLCLYLITWEPQICNKQHFHLSKFEVEHKYFHQNLKWVLNFILDNMISKVISPKQKGFILTLSWQLTSQTLKLMFLTFGGVWGSPREAFESPGSETHHYLWHVTEYEDTFSSKKTNIQS